MRRAVDAGRGAGARAAPAGRPGPVCGGSRTGHCSICTAASVQSIAVFFSAPTAQLHGRGFPCPDGPRGGRAALPRPPAGCPGPGGPADLAARSPIVRRRRGERPPADRQGRAHRRVAAGAVPDRCASRCRRAGRIALPTPLSTLPHRNTGGGRAPAAEGNPVGGLGSCLLPVAVSGGGRPCGPAGRSVPPTRAGPSVPSRPARPALGGLPRRPRGRPPCGGAPHTPDHREAGRPDGDPSRKAGPWAAAAAPPRHGRPRRPDGDPGGAGGGSGVPVPHRSCGEWNPPARGSSPLSQSAVPAPSDRGETCRSFSPE